MRCLAALMPQVTGMVDVVVVDNASTDDLSLVSGLYPDLRVVTEHDKGAACARNRGVAETRAAYLFFLDCDCVPSDNWVATALRIKDQADVIGGKITVFDETPGPRSGAEAFETVFAFDNAGYIRTKGFSVTANLLTKRSIFDDVGGFRASMSEDLDWCQRATEKGYQLRYDAELSVAHPTRSTWGDLRKKWHRLTVETWGLQDQNAGARVKWMVRACAMPVSALIHLPKLLLSPDLRDFTERWRGASTLIRLRLTRARWMVSQVFAKAR